MLNPNDVLSHISFLLVFLEGLLSFLSPCVLPLPLHVLHLTSCFPPLFYVVYKIDRAAS